MLLVTGGAGFIGSNFILDWMRRCDEPVVNVDKLTYAGNLQNLAEVAGHPSHVFVRADIGDMETVARALDAHAPRAVLNFAAESHVDRSIHDADDFIQTNVVGTLRLLKAACAYWGRLPADRQRAFRFLHVSTDEVYGSLGASDPAFRETTPYAPNSPYAASKAASDHLVRSFHHTHGLPTLTTNCSNNYGPRQFPEKLIPLVIHNALSGEPIPVYGDGGNIRDWLHVSDHCDAICAVLQGGRVGETYNIGGDSELRNIDVVGTICAALDRERPRADGRSYGEQITFVTDRPGHDRRYAVDATKIRDEIGWRPRESFETGIGKTIRWYLDNEEWIRNVTSGAYRDWVAIQYNERLASA
jgi:dTDP-glucose 4,6-dehydratase